jgi:hypothetical protein
MLKISKLGFQSVLRVLLMVVSIAVLLPPAGIARAATPSAAQFCQCVEYVKNKFHLSGSAGQAKNMGPYLQARGFVKLTVPRPGEVIIMQPGFHTNSSAGHVAIIQTVVETNKGKSWKITVRGANQPGSRWIEANCTDVSFWSFEYSKPVNPAADTRVQYYGKK